MTLRKKISLSLVGLVVLIGAGVFVWGALSGRLGMLAEKVKRAASPTTATITGTVSGFSGYGYVCAACRDCGDPLLTYTAAVSDGRYTMTVPPEKYLVWLVADCDSRYQNCLLRNFAGPVNLSAGQTANIDLTYRTDFHALVYGLDPLTNLLAPLVGVSVTLGTGTQTFDPVVSDSQGYITSSQATNAIQNRLEIRIVAVSKPGFLINSFSLWPSQGCYPQGCDFARELRVNYSVVAQNISGTVKDKWNQQPIEGAQVTGVGSQTVTTDTQGAYSFANVPTGTYQIKATKSGYKDQTQEITVSGQSQQVNFELEKARAVLLTWDQPEDEFGTPPGYGYEIFRQAPGQTERELIWTIDPLEEGVSEGTGGGVFFDQTVDIGSTYTYYVEAFDRAGNRSTAAQITVTVQ